MTRVGEFTEDMARLIHAIRGHAGEVLLFMASFDGVLVDYQADPSAACVPPARLELLTRLQRCPDVDVAVISGRPLDDLRPRLPLGDSAFYAGLHGLEVEGPWFAEVKTDAIDTYRQRMAEVAVVVRERVADVRGVTLEHKGPIVALHTRDADPDAVVWSRFQLLSAAADLVNSGSVRALRGQEVLELLPNVGKTRADAVRTIERCVEARHGRRVFTVYVGADWPDDDAAQVGGGNQVAVVVGRRARIGHRIESPDHLDGLLAELIADRA